MSPVAGDILIAIGLFALLLVSLECGYRWGLSASSAADTRSAGQVGAVQGAILGLLGLLLAFSFAAAGGRFLERQDLIVKEANAIGTAFLRADLLNQPHRSELRAALQRYTEHRLEVSKGLSRGIGQQNLNEIDQNLKSIWRAASKGALETPAAMVAVLNPVNEVIDLHTLRLAAARKHLPALVLGLLIASSALSLAIIGYGSGMGGRRNAPLTVSLALLIGTALWITVDLDHPRSGLMHLSDAPLQELSFEAPSD